MLPVSPAIALKEMESIKFIVDKWVERVTEGIPIVTFSAKDEDLELYLRQWIGELRIVSGKADNLADVLSGAR